MKKYMVIIVTVIIATGYIFGIDYYDKQEVAIEKLYEAIKKPEITYEHIEVSLTGRRADKQLGYGDLYEMQNKAIHYLSHDETCSKLCALVHSSTANLQKVEKEESIGLLAEEKKGDTDYELLIQNQKDTGYHTYFKSNISGGASLSQLDWFRNRTIDLFKQWDVNPDESVYFVGKLQGNITKQQRKQYSEKFMSALKADYRTYYQDDVNPDVEAYYGYTPQFKTYLLGAGAEKTNMQVSFSYDELTDETNIIVAFPFYNEPF